MLGFIAMKLLQQLSTKAHQSSNFRAFHSSTAALRTLTPLQHDCKANAFTVSFLVNSCGVDVDAANKISKKLRIKSAVKPSRTLNFLRSYGFTDAQISTIVTASPFVLHSDPVKTLKPKFDHFTSLGASNESLFNIIRYIPEILIHMNLKERLVPVLDLIKSIVGSNEELIALLTRHHMILRHNPFTTLVPNVAFLQNSGMTELSILRFLMFNGNAFRTEPVKFKVMADRALAMGFDVEKIRFGGAINAFTALTEENWEKKVEVFRKWRWSESEFNVAFRKEPRIMLLSEANIEGTMGYLVDKMGVDAALLARSPYILLYSLKKRIIPRCFMVRVLLSKGLIEKDYCMYYMIKITDESFLKEFVEKHVGVRSELLTLYRSLMH